MLEQTRRAFVKGVAAIGGIIALGVRPVLAAWPAAAFDAKDVKELDAALFAGKPIEKTDKVELRMPEIAENGGQVPITVTSSLPDTQSITIIAEGNPRPMVVRFHLSKQASGKVSTRMKLAKTQNINAVVEAGGKLFKATKEIKVSIGGCGG